jgi:hypothetical protein
MVAALPNYNEETNYYQITKEIAGGKSTGQISSHGRGLDISWMDGT